MVLNYLIKGLFGSIYIAIHMGAGGRKKAEQDE